VSILRPWVEGLGLRFQGVLLSAVRGCDTAARHDVSKRLVRVYRAEILQTRLQGDPKKSKSFIEHAEVYEAEARMNAFLDDCDHYPSHYVMHLTHAAEIVGYHHPDPIRRDLWRSFYRQLCAKFHLAPETQEELRLRLEEDEEAFHAKQKPAVRAEAERARQGGS